MATAQTETAEELKAKLILDKRFFIENLMLIPNKNRVSVPFIFNLPQQMLYESLSNKTVVLKARQEGVTSLIMALFLQDCITRPNTTSVVIAHEEFITQRLLAKAKIFEASIPPEVKPEMHHKSAYELSWEDIHSTFYIGSARSFVFGRGERIDNALCSEVAFWQNPEKIINPLLAMPEEGHIILESTPNGEDNYFCDTWKQAVRGWKDGASLFKPLFFPWWLCDDYQLGVEKGLPADAHSPLEYDGEEADLVKRHNLSEGQIRWRRLKLASPLGIMFKQEYAEDDQSCFLQVREAIFDTQVLNEKARGCFPPVDSFENTAIWFKPEEHHIYILGADPTVGIHDPAAFTVWDLAGLKLCARFKNILEPKPLAEKLKLIGRYYNKALLVVENNNPGVAVLSYLMDYENLFYMRDINTGRPSGRAGWTTSAQSKSYMLQQFRQLLPQLTIPDIELIREARGFRYDGLSIETSGDDHLMMSAMLALAARDASAGKPAFQGTWGWSW